MTLIQTTAFALLCVLGAQVSAAAEKPNILIIYADDLGYGDVQCNNPELAVAATFHSQSP